MQAQWDDDVHHTLHALLTGERQAYYVDFGSLGAVAKVLTSAFFLFFASLTSYVAIRSKGLRPWQVIAADWTFIAGLTLLGLAVLVAAVEL